VSTPRGADVATRIDRAAIAGTGRIGSTYDDEVTD
jgi:hypothetical protein